jgi:uncharacterized protein (TIGR03437 family)
VLIAGGVKAGAFGGIPIATAEIYTPGVTIPPPAILWASDGQASILHASTELPVSPENPAVAGEALEIYATGLIEDGKIPPQVFIGGQMAEMLFFGDAPGYPRYNQVNIRVPSGVAAGSTVPVRLTYISRPSNQVAIGVR